MTVTVSPTSWRTTSRDSGRAVARRTAVGPHSLVSYCGWYRASAGAPVAPAITSSAGPKLPPAVASRGGAFSAERRRHLVHAVRNHAELLGLVLIESLVVVTRRHALERPDDVGERGCETPTVVPEPDAEHHEHDHEDHRGLGRRLDRVVADFGGE